MKHLLEKLLQSDSMPLPANLYRAAVRHGVAPELIAGHSNVPADTQALILSEADTYTAARLLLHNGSSFVGQPRYILEAAISQLPESRTPKEAAHRILEAFLDKKLELGSWPELIQDLLPFIDDLDLLEQWLNRDNTELTSEDHLYVTGMIAARLSVAETEEQLLNATPQVRRMLLRFGVSPTLAALTAVDLVRDGHFTAEEVAPYFTATDGEFRTEKLKEFAKQGNPVPANWEELIKEQKPGIAEQKWAGRNLRTQPSELQFTDRVEDVAWAVQHFQNVQRVQDGWMERMVFNAICNPAMPPELRQTALVTLRDTQNGLYPDAASIRKAINRINPRERFPNEPQTWDLWCDVFPAGLLLAGNVEAFGGESGIANRIALWETRLYAYWREITAIAPTSTLLNAMPLYALPHLAEDSRWATFIAEAISALYSTGQDTQYTLEGLMDTRDTLTFQQFADNVRAVTQ